MMECTDADVDEKIDRHRRRQQQKDPCENESIGCNYWEVIKYGLGEDIVEWMIRDRQERRCEFCGGTQNPFLEEAKEIERRELEQKLEGPP